MTTHTVSYFRNHALQLLDTVEVTGEGLVITRRGKPIAQVFPAKTARRGELGRLKGTMEIVGDIVGPSSSDDWTACR